MLMDQEVLWDLIEGNCSLKNHPNEVQDGSLDIKLCETRPIRYHPGLMSTGRPMGLTGCPRKLVIRILGDIMNALPCLQLENKIIEEIDSIYDETLCQISEGKDG